MATPASKSASDDIPRPTLAEVLANEAWLKSLEEYSKKHLCNEHLDFYRAVIHYKCEIHRCLTSLPLSPEARCPPNVYVFVDIVFLSL